MSGDRIEDAAWWSGRADALAWLVDGEAYFRALYESLTAARHEILILGWDVDSRLRLRRDGADARGLAQLLEDLAAERDSLEVRLLSWDFAFVYVLERELQPARKFGWYDRSRLSFRLDGAHPVGASHHEKIVVVDGAVAFCGGMDLTKVRWDTREHAPDTAGRRSTEGEPYRPFHDVQALVAGEPAAAFRRWFVERWQTSEGERLPEPGWTPDWRAVWPASATSVPPGGRVHLARTVPVWRGRPAVREVQETLLAMIRTAERHLYVENQYVSSPLIAEALAARLAEPDGPDVVIVVPEETSGWLEQVSMEARRRVFFQRLQKADVHDRLLVRAPARDDLGKETINLHSKVMIVDDRYARVGSANLNNRSLGVDTECDLILDANDDEGGRRAVTGLLAELVGEHLDLAPERIERELAEGVRLREIIRKAPRRRRHLAEVSTEPTAVDDVLGTLAELIDPEEPMNAVWTGEQT